MTFEEEFPSLKGLKVIGNVMNRKEIQEHCLDKQKVKEILNKKITCRCGSRDCIDCQETIEAEDIMEKLGLNKEGVDNDVKQ